MCVCVSVCARAFRKQTVFRRWMHGTRKLERMWSCGQHLKTRKEVRSDQQASENDKKKRSSDSELEEVFQPGIPTTVYGIFATTKTTKKTNKQNDTNHQHSNKTATQLARHSSKQSIEITQGYNRKGSNLAASRRRNQRTGSTVFCFPFDLNTQYRRYTKL